MKRFVLAVCFALPASSAMSQDVPPDLEQLFRSTQEVLQNMSEDNGPTTTPSAEGTVAVPALAETPLTLTQTGMNAANIVYLKMDLGTVVQHFDGIQTVENTIEMTRTPGLGPISIDQTGSNYANLAYGHTISLADQAMWDGSRQLVSNIIDIGGPVGAIHQQGINAANVAKAELAIDAANQFIGHDVEQKVWNYIEFGADSVYSGGITQTGMNIGNVLISDRIDNVTREFYGTQIVHNEIVLNTATVPMISQSGTNIANLVVANDIGSVQQISEGTQLVENVVTDAAGNPIHSANISQNDYNYQGPTNIINMMVLRGRHTHDGNDKPVAIEQQANFPQTGHGVSGSQTGNMTVIVR